MKKVLILTVAIGMTLGLVSCSKDHTCTCSGNLFASGDTTISLIYDGVKKKDAETSCSNAQTSFKTIDANATCSLD